MAVYDEGYAPAAGAPRFTNLVNFAGAALSLALILGVGLWGYKLIVRDVSGIPVVRAMEGDMRVLPDDPGGGVSVNIGLSVNEVAAVGEAGGPEDRLVLAPRTSGLAQEDLEVQPIAEVPQAVVPETEPHSTPEVVVTLDDAEVIAAELAALGSPSSPEAGQGVAAAAIVDSATAVSRSLRPVLRPTSAATSASVIAAPAAIPAVAATGEVAVTTTVFPTGTNLVQLGAFPNPSLAAEEWDRLQARFGQLMAERNRVIQVSNQSTATWYRLRASGFADRAEARRLCAVLQAEGNDCIALVVN